MQHARAVSCPQAGGFVPKTLGLREAPPHHEIESFIAEIRADPKLGPIVQHQSDWRARLAGFEQGMGWIHTAGADSAYAIELEDRVRDIARSRQRLKARLLALDRFADTIDGARLDREVGPRIASALRVVQH